MTEKTTTHTKIMSVGARISCSVGCGSRRTSLPWLDSFVYSHTHANVTHHIRPLPHQRAGQRAILTSANKATHQRHAARPTALALCRCLRACNFPFSRYSGNYVELRACYRLCSLQIPLILGTKSPFMHNCRSHLNLNHPI